MLAIDPATALWFIPFVLPLVIWVSWSDMASMKIPNKAVLATLAVFAVVGLAALPFTDYIWRWAHFAVVIFVGFLLSTGGLVGAGDAKYAAAMAPFIALSDWFAFMILLTAVILAAFVLHRATKASPMRARFENWESWTRKEFPMGMALAPALLFYLILGALGV